MISYWIVVVWVCVAITAQTWALRPLVNNRPVNSRSFNRFNTFAKKQTEAKGFGTKKKSKSASPKSPSADSTVSQTELVSTSATDSTTTGNSDTASSTAANDEATDADAIFKKYRISDGESNAAASKKAKKSTTFENRPEDAPFGESVLEKIPPALQSKIDNILITATFSSLMFVLACGVGISLGSLKVVFPDISIPEGVDALLTNFLTPAFTPAFAIFLFFSVTFGLFKFAQVSSSQTVYKE
jgi:hypothetical protein